MGGGGGVQFSKRLNLGESILKMHKMSGGSKFKIQDRHFYVKVVID